MISCHGGTRCEGDGRGVGKHSVSVGNGFRKLRRRRRRKKKKRKGSDPGWWVCMIVGVIHHKALQADLLMSLQERVLVLRDEALREREEAEDEGK